MKVKCMKGRIGRKHHRKEWRGRGQEEEEEGERWVSCSRAQSQEVFHSVALTAFSYEMYEILKINVCVCVCVCQLWCTNTYIKVIHACMHLFAWHVHQRDIFLYVYYSCCGFFVCVCVCLVTEVFYKASRNEQCLPLGSVWSAANWIRENNERVREIVHCFKAIWRRAFEGHTHTHTHTLTHSHTHTSYAAIFSKV